jgi:CarboxypepD_reg-like domain
MKRLLFLACLLCFISSRLWAQEPVDPRIFQISGMIVSKSSDEPIGYATVQINHTRRGAVANEQGFYSIAVGLLDTLYFSHLGYYPSKLVLRDYIREYQGDISSQYLYVVNYMLEDTFTLSPVFIFPYDTPEELRTAVVNMDMTVGALERNARENMDPRTLHEIMASLPVDGGERLMVARQIYYDYYHSKNLIPTVGFDPVTAMRLLQYVVQQNKRRKNKDLNYWSD